MVSTYNSRETLLSAGIHFRREAARWRCGCETSRELTVGGVSTTVESDEVDGEQAVASVRSGWVSVSPDVFQRRVDTARACVVRRVADSRPHARPGQMGISVSILCSADVPQLSPTHATVQPS